MRPDLYDLGTRSVYKNLKGVPFPLHEAVSPLIGVINQLSLITQAAAIREGTLPLEVPLCGLIEEVKLEDYYTYGSPTFDIASLINIQTTFIEYCNQAGLLEVDLSEKNQAPGITAIVRYRESAHLPYFIYILIVQMDSWSSWAPSKTTTISSLLQMLRSLGNVTDSIMMATAKIPLDSLVFHILDPTALIDGKRGRRPLTAETTLRRKHRKHGANGSRVKSFTRPPSLVFTAFAACCSSIRFRFMILLRYAYH